jgi:hypothetical protein
MRSDFNSPKLFFTLLFVATVLSLPVSGESILQNEMPDTTFIAYPTNLKASIPKQHAYHQTLTLKLFMSQALFDGKLKRKDNGESEIFLNCEQTLEVIRKIDKLTLGIPKIVYLVGWQYNGHDSKYPAWFEGNKKLKRPGDTNALESLKWLMKEAEKYHTTVSLHINMFDAYEDSPLWDTYVKNDIIAKNTDGTLRACEWGYPISYAQEWKTGFVQKRIDSLCNLLPIQKAGTIHIDAFHTWPPVPGVDENGKYTVDLTKGPISPYLNFSVQDETETQLKIFRYWASKGIDVTSEGVDFLRETTFEGYQPMSWWFGGLDGYLKWPASYYCGGKDNSDWGKLFGTSMHGEDIVKKDPHNLSGFLQQFCTSTAVWYYLNLLERKYVVVDGDDKSVHFSNNVTTSLVNGNYTLMQGNVTLVENDDIFIPAAWLKKPSIIAYSKNGYQNKTWTFPDDWGKVKKVKLSLISVNGKKKMESVRISNGKLILSLEKDQAIIIEKQ